MAYYPVSTEVGAHYRLLNPRTGAVAAFNTPLDPNYAGMLKEVNGLDSPEVREQAEDLVETDGGAHGNFYHGRRPITLNSVVFGHSTVKQRDAMIDRQRRASLGMKHDVVLSWKPSTRNENGIANPRYGISAISNWTRTAQSGITASSTSRVTGVGAPNGTDSAINISATSNAANLTYTSLATAWYNTNPANYRDYSGAIHAGQYVHASVNMRLQSISAGGSPTVTLRVRCYTQNATNGQLSADLGTINITSRTIAVADNWVTLSGTLAHSALPAGTTVVVFETVLTTAAAATTVWRETNASLSIRNDNVVQPYIDGAQAGGFWHAGPDISPSGDFIPVQVFCRRQQPFREMGAWVKETQLSLVAADPYILSQYVRPVQITVKTSAFVDNQGNATYYPVTWLTNDWGVNATIESQDDIQFTRMVTIIDPVLWPTGYAFSGGAGVLDFKNHTFFLQDGSNFGGNIDWANVSVWPGVRPGGNTWTVTDVEVGTTGVLEVRMRDAWV